ncbi:hypothetical protein HQQ94_02210 [Shewanella sp. VB17]|uniref:hypothetical protein n=1 Tax=Shewanella sp. VB17 TaxID=2739432 RepID=UPI0015670200|nr:hypothetical protein [Shewanella sp. VB17]NRD72074.1 hypothetical protein [Shewanella sp. VB17]
MLSRIITTSRSAFVVAMLSAIVNLNTSIYLWELIQYLPHIRMAKVGETLANYHQKIK